MQVFGELSHETESKTGVSCCLFSWGVARVFTYSHTSCKEFFKQGRRLLMTNPTQLALNSQKILEEGGTPGFIAQTVARLVYLKAKKAKQNG